MGDGRRIREARSSEKWGEHKEIPSIRRISRERCHHELGMRPGLKKHRPPIFHDDEY